MIDMDKFDISFYQKFLKELYSDINTKRQFDNIYGYLHRTTGYLGKEIIEDSVKVNHFILPISWIFSLASLLEIDLQDAFLHKYPGICTYCLQEQCVCYKTKKKPLKPLPAYRSGEEKNRRYETLINTISVFNLNKATQLIQDVFAVNEAIWYFAGPWHHIAKINEEIAEIHEAYGSFTKGEKPKRAVADEIADVLAWILAAWAILFPNTSLDDVFVSYYYDGCPVCGNPDHCRCGLYDSRPGSLLDYKQLRIIKENLQELSRTIQGDSSEIAELIKFYEEVLQTQDEPIAKLTIFQTKDYLESRKTAKIYNEEADDRKLLISSTLEKINDIIKSVEYRKQRIPQYDVFLSYTKTDKNEATAIYSYLKGRKISVYLAEKELIPATKWEPVVKEALHNAKLLCILVTPDSLKSEWVTMERGAAWVNDIPILSVILRCSLEELPEILRAYQVIDYHQYQKIPEILAKIKTMSGD